VAAAPPTPPRGPPRLGSIHHVRGRDRRVGRGGVGTALGSMALPRIPRPPGEHCEHWRVTGCPAWIQTGNVCPARVPWSPASLTAQESQLLARKRSRDLGDGAVLVGDHGRCVLLGTGSDHGLVGASSWAPRLGVGLVSGSSPPPREGVIVEGVATVEQPAAVLMSTDPS
jgi:hypothetical protein